MSPSQVRIMMLMGMILMASSASAIKFTISTSLQPGGEDTKRWYILLQFPFPAAHWRSRLCLGSPLDLLEITSSGCGFSAPFFPKLERALFFLLFSSFLDWLDWTGLQVLPSGSFGFGWIFPISMTDCLIAWGGCWCWCWCWLEDGISSFLL